jgi:hypothetical protein
LQQPARGKQAVIHDALERCIQGEPVVDRHDHDAARGRYCRIQSVIHAGIADHPAAPMHIQHDAAYRSCRPEYPQRDPKAIHRGGRAFHANTRALQVALGHQLCKPKQGLAQTGRPRVADPEAGRPRQLAIEAAGFLDRFVVEQGRHA